MRVLLFCLFLLLTVGGCNAIQDDASVSGQEANDAWHDTKVSIQNSGINMDDLKRITSVIADAEAEGQLPQAIEELEANGVKVKKVTSGRYIIVISGITITQTINVDTASSAARSGTNTSEGGNTGDKDQKADGELEVPVIP